MAPQALNHRPLWSRVDRQDLGMAMSLIGAGLSLYGFCTVGYPRVIIPMLTAVAGAVLFDRGVHYFRTPFTDFPRGTMGPMNVGQAAPPGRSGVHPQVERLLRILHTHLKDEFTLEWPNVETDGDVLVAYSLKGIRPGLLVNEGFKTKVTNILTGDALPAPLGSWEIGFDSENDQVLASQRQKLKKVEFPPHWPVCLTREEARRKYPSFTYKLGIGENGSVIEFRPESIPHLGVWGTSGSGKSVMVQNLIEQFRAAGFQIVICDPKQVDYAALARENNVAAVASSVEEQIILVHQIRRILDGRKTFSQKEILKGNTRWAESLDPILLILDEFASVRSNIDGLYGKKRKDRMASEFDSDIEEILRQGRALRIHVLLANQDIYNSSVPGAWQNNIQVNICMGPPHHLTVGKAFPVSAQPMVKRIGSTIGRGQQGRGLVAVTDQEGSSARVMKFQGFYSYSPAADMSKITSSATQQVWDAFKLAVSDRIPKLYRRFWVIPEYPEQEKWEKSDPYTQEREDFKETGRVNLSKLSISGLHRLKLVFLDDEAGNPIADNKIYDLREESYLASTVGEADFVM